MMILPYDANSSRVKFLERTGTVTVRTSRMASGQAGKALIFILVQQSSGESRLSRPTAKQELPTFERKDGAARLVGVSRHAHPRQE